MSLKDKILEILEKYSIWEYRDYGGSNKVIHDDDFEAIAQEIEDYVISTTEVTFDEEDLLP